MPKSRQRKKPDRPRREPPAPRRPGSAKRWAAPAMLTCWLVGLAWVIVFYVAGSEIPGMRELGNWNLLLGMGLIAVGFVFATQWECARRE